MMTPWKDFRTRIRFVLSLLLLGGVVSAEAAPGTAIEEKTALTDPPTIVGILQQELQQSAPGDQAVVLSDIVRLAACTASCRVELRSLTDEPVEISVDNMIGEGTLVDLSVLAPDLRRVYESGATDELRLMALSALLSIGTEAELIALAHSLADQSERIREITRRSLVSYFTQVYPSLKSASDRNNGQLSIDQIREAHVAKKRAEQKASRKAARNARKVARKAVREAKQKTTGSR